MCVYRSICILLYTDTYYRGQALGGLGPGVQGLGFKAPGLGFRVVLKVLGKEGPWGVHSRQGRS